MDTASWLFNFIPWWAWVVAAIIAAVLTYQFWLPIWAMLPRPVKVALAAIAAVLTAYVAGRNKGSKDERDRRAKADANAIKNRKDIDDEVRNRPAATVDRDLDKWMRD
jgi:hypothetical protein